MPQTLRGGLIIRRGPVVCYWGFILTLVEIIFNGVEPWGWSRRQVTRERTNGDAVSAGFQKDIQTKSCY